ncbi:MAG: PIN domain-containing protein [Frankiaceae bacterium]|nr:PIN domain-containing protein [Frankiaceae bacterium]
MPTLDTNVLLRWLLADLPEQAAAAEALLASGARCVVPDVALVEMVFVLERAMRLPRTTAAQAVETVLAIADVDADRGVWHAALADYLAHPKLSIADTYLAAAASASQHTPLYTSDRQLASQLGAAELLS